MVERMARVRFLQMVQLIPVISVETKKEEYLRMYSFYSGKFSPGWTVPFDISSEKNGFLVQMVSAPSKAHLRLRKISPGWTVPFDISPEKNNAGFSEKMVSALEVLETYKIDDIYRGLVAKIKDHRSVVRGPQTYYVQSSKFISFVFIQFVIVRALHCTCSFVFIQFFIVRVFHCTCSFVFIQFVIVRVFHCTCSFHPFSFSLFWYDFARNA